MVKKFTIEEAREYDKLGKDLAELERFISDGTYKKVAQDILHLNVLRNKEVFSSISGIILKDINSSIERLKEEIGNIGKEYKS